MRIELEHTSVYMCGAWDEQKNEREVRETEPVRHEENHSIVVTQKPNKDILSKEKM